MQRKTYSSFPKIVLPFLALAAGAGLAQATTISVPGVDWTRGESIWIDEYGTPQQAYFAGVIFITLNQDGQQFNRDTLCVDLFTDIYLGNTYATQLFQPSQIPGRNLEQVSWLVDNALLPTQDNQYGSVLPQSDWVTTPAQGAGIQLAIWDITSNSGDGLFAGSVQASTVPGEETDPAVVAWAETYEALSTGKQSNLAYVYQNWDPGSLARAQMLEGPLFTDAGPKPDPPAPEPVTCGLVGVALIGLGLLRRGKHKSARR
jgi:hypothetical protein